MGKKSKKSSGSSSIGSFMNKDFSAKKVLGKGKL